MYFPYLTYGYGYFSYLLFLLPGLVLVLIAQLLVKSAYNRYSRVDNSQHLSGADAAAAVLKNAGVDGIAIKRVSGEMTDHYNPADNSIYLSEGVYDSTSIAAVGIAAHEAGHAVQYAQGYVPIRFRMSILPICNFGSRFGIPLAFLGVLFDLLGLVWLGLMLFGLTLLFQLVTLPVEFNASRRAMGAINNGLLIGDEARGARKVLTAAAMTYVAAMLQSLLYFLYYAMRFLGGRSRR